MGGKLITEGPFKGWYQIIPGREYKKGFDPSKKIRKPNTEEYKEHIRRLRGLKNENKKL